MQRTTIWSLLLGIALAMTWVTPGFGCEACGIPSDSPCICPAGFLEGDSDDPAAFQTLGNGWSFTSGGSSPSGEPALLTWSIVPDGTTLPRGVGEPDSPSNLIEFLDGIHHGGPGPGGTDLTQRAWFTLFESSFERWDALSAISFSYESQDDGTALGGLSGVLGRRGDHRIGGHSLDGVTSPTFLAYNYFPNNSDMVLDTDEVGRFGNPSNNYLRFRNTLMHEIGHGLGLDHPSAAGNNFLMEAFLDTTIDGPQFDDVLGVHRLYGDRFEENGGNDSRFSPTNLGSLSIGTPIQLGADATDAFVAPTDIDFVSINKSSDTDFFRFSVADASIINIVLTPLGPTYLEGPQGETEVPLVASARNDLGLFLYDSSGLSLLADSTTGGLGVAESLRNFAIPAAGDYLIRIAGMQDSVQFYQLDLAIVPEPTGLLLLLASLASCLACHRPRQASPLA